MRDYKDNHRVVITGLGVVSSLGIGWEKFWENLMAGKSGIKKISLFDTKKYERHYAGEISGFNSQLRYGRSSQFAILATKLAFADAGINKDSAFLKECGVGVGTTMGEAQVIEEIVLNYLESKSTVVQGELASFYPASIISANIAKELQLSNKNIVFSTACAAGNYSIGYAFDLIRTGKISCMLAGGVDSLSRIAFTGFNRLFAVAEERCQPFDKNRTGMITGEGAGMLFLERLDSAVQRRAPIYAEVLSYGMSCDAGHMTSPDSVGVVKALKKAIYSGNVSIDDVDYISAHGTGTPENDRAECYAIREVFKKRYKKIPVSSIKSMLGHTMGAASALETIACCLAIQNQEIPPTINFVTKDQECDIDCVPNEGRKHKIKIVLNNSQAFGGNNAVLVLRKIKI